MEIVVRASVIFFFLFLLTRGSKRRTLADFAPFELLLLVTIGDIVQQAVTQEDMSITGGVLAAATFAFWVSVLSFVTWRWPRANEVIEGVPLVIIKDGHTIDQVLRTERLPLSEVHEAARQHGIASLSAVRLGVLEPTGKISFIMVDGSDPS
jgi:uncharacterized membrane protein YcaP (DUF421 family)